MTGGRTEPGPNGAHFDLIALVAVADSAPDSSEECLLGPEHRALLALCRSETQSVAELAADADLPVGVVRVLLGDLLEAGYVRVSRPVPCGTTARRADPSRGDQRTAGTLNHRSGRRPERPDIDAGSGRDTGRALPITLAPVRNFPFRPVSVQLPESPRPHPSSTRPSPGRPSARSARARCRAARLTRICPRSWPLRHAFQDPLGPAPHSGQVRQFLRSGQRDECNRDNREVPGFKVVAQRLCSVLPPDVPESAYRDGCGRVRRSTCTATLVGLRNRATSGRGRTSSHVEGGKPDGRGDR